MYLKVRTPNRLQPRQVVSAIVALFVVVPIIGTVFVRTFFANWHLVSDPLHSTLEMAGAMAALSLAFAILITPDERSRTANRTLAVALIAMGSLDTAHAALTLGNASVWLRSLATLAGGLICASIWLPKISSLSLRKISVAAVVLAICIYIPWGAGFLKLALPTALTGDRVINAIALINYIGGLGFLAACLRFCILLKHSHRVEDLLNANFCFLFGSSGLLLPSSHLWGGEWWYWHALRLLGYLLILAHASLTLGRTSRALETTNLELSNTLRRLQLATNSAAIGIWDWDVAADHLIWDDELYRIYGVTQDQFGGNLNSWLACIAPEERTKARAAVEASMREESELSGEFRIIWPDGSEHFILAAGKTYRNPKSKVLRMIGVNQDVTARRLAERQLRNHREHLEELVAERTSAWRIAAADAQAANQAKSIFLSNMSHELRTPMNAIIGFSTLMQRDSGLTAAQHQNLSIISRSGDHLLTLINDVLDMSKIESGRVNLESTAFDLHAMLRGVVDLMQERAEAKSLSLDLQQSSNVPRCVRGDEGKLRQILINLLGNSVKFTSRGGVVMRLELDSAGEVPMLLVEIEDTGAGIALEDQPLIFKPFVQVGDQYDQKGTGLGLTITKQFIELMGGTIGLESTRGLGTLFKLKLPIVQAGAAEVAEPLSTGRRVLHLAPNQPTVKILVVEDQEDNALLIERLLTSVGFDVRIVRDGEAGVAAFEQDHPDFIWMDRRMPRMDGIEACKRIRALPGGDRVRIVGLTASILHEERAELLGAGMDEIICKPYTHDEIFGCMARQLKLTYVYEDIAPCGSSVVTDITRLALLPLNQRQNLRAALFDFDHTTTTAIIEAITDVDAELGKALLYHVDQSNHSAVLQALNDADKSEV